MRPETRSRSTGLDRAAAPRRARWCVVLLALLLGAPAAAQPRDPLAAAGRDPMELARAVDHLGDAEVLRRLETEARADRLTAVYATPWLHSPEHALPTLSSMASGRDPALAPAAALASVRIARRLDAGALFRRESPPSALVEATTRYRRLADDDTARTDLRAAARVVVAQLTEAGAAPEAP